MLVECWFAVFVTGIGSMLVFAGMNITLLCKNTLFIGRLVQHIHLLILLLVLYFGVTYKPKWAGYDIVIIFNHHFDLFVHVTIIKIYNAIQYNTLMLTVIRESGQCCVAFSQEIYIKILINLLKLFSLLT